jgi:hypothetical protein
LLMLALICSRLVTSVFSLGQWSNDSFQWRYLNIDLLDKKDQ